MHVLQFILVLVAVGVLIWLVDKYLDLVKTVVVFGLIAAIFRLMKAFRLIEPLSDIRIGGRLMRR